MEYRSDSVLKMPLTFFLVVLTVVTVLHVGDGQVVQFGTCPEVQTMKYFDLESFLGTWYEVARFPAWYEAKGTCAYKRIQYCGRRIEFEHVYVRDGIQYVLHVNSTYSPGDEAVFVIQQNNIDPLGIPLHVLSTDYTNYALVYGCRYNTDIDLKHINAWILSRDRTLPEDILRKVYAELNTVPNASTTYLEMVDQSERTCQFHWVAHVQAVDTNSTSDNK